MNLPEARGLWGGLVGALVGATLASPGMTAAALPGSPVEGRIVADLHVGRDTVALRERGRGPAGDLILSRAGLRYAERHGPVSLALSGGYARASHEAGAGRGMRPGGSYVGLELRADRPLGRRLAIGLDLGIRGAWLRDSHRGLEVRQEHVEGEAGLRLSARAGERLVLHVGPMWTRWQADVRRRQADVQAVTYRSRRAAGARAGVALDLDDGGRVGLEGRGGAVRGLEVTFLRSF